MSADTILPSDLHRKILDWLLDYAPTPMMRLVAGYSLSDTVEWYNRIMTNDLNRWADQATILMGRTLKLVSMKLIDDGKVAVFIYKPYESDAQELTIRQILEPVQKLNKAYRRNQAVDKASALSLPKLLVGLISECDDSGNEMRVIIPEGGPAHGKLHQLIDAALLENTVKSDKALVKWGIPLHKLKTQSLQKNLYKGLFFEFINHLSIHLYSESYSWGGKLFINVILPEWDAEKLLRNDIDKLSLPEPKPVEVIEKPTGRTFLLAGQTFTEGDKLTIITPELGTLIATTTIQPFGANKVVGLELTPLLFVTNCSSKLSFYSNGQGYHTLQLAYHCGCGHNVHPRSLQWFGLEIDGTTIRAKEPARPEKPLKPLVLPPIKTEQLAIKPEVKPVIKPEPEVSANKKGQFLLF
ncbi:hypothetical protein GO755_38970 [Spirosoma sp. HMF4905]|uniref:Uncharacterized protein n=1 Tax=Spirosoma arboris TaxID=2682092 RepID=A0A7K1SQJ3_9BACT|nr:hypothetical protein [Spirosoma arboris]MVM36061.1 hypothetical protein [Spirosoma arboris]